MSVASSSDGTKLAAAYYYAGAYFDGGIYTSTISGASWAQTIAGTFYPVAIASSADGCNLVGARGAIVTVTGESAGTGPIYISTNSGGAWVQTSAPVGTWNSVASSADGTKLVAVVRGGGVWTAQATIQTTTTPGTAGYLSGGQNSAIELQYIGNGQFMPLSYVGTISGSSDKFVPRVVQG